MNKYKRTSLAALLGLLCAGAKAQLTIGGAVNSGASLHDWSTQAVVPAAYTYATTGSTGSNNGVFQHYGPSGTGGGSALVVHGTYDATTYGVDRFSGPNNAPGQQGIGGSRRARFDNLWLVNGSSSRFDITNGNGVYVNTGLHAENGITTTDRTNPVAGSVFMSAAAAFNGSRGNGSYLNGYATRIGGTAFTFPVGSQHNNEYRPLTVAAAAANGASSAVSVAYFTGDPEATTDPTDGATHSRSALASGLLSVSNRGWWDFEFRTGLAGNDGTSQGSHAVPTAAITVSVSMPDMTGAGGYNPTDMVLVGWDAGQSKWIPLGGANATGNAAGSTLSGAVPANTDVTAIGIGSIASFLLPVKLTQFTAVLGQNCTAQLTWQSAQESANGKFLVEYSTDGSRYVSVGTVAFRNPGSGGGYSFAYAGLQKGAGYFRLRIEEGTAVQYSGVARVDAGCNQTEITAAPNPVQHTVRITGLNGKSIIRLYDVAGNLLQELGTAASAASVEVGRYPAGTYLLEVYADGRLEKSIRLVKQP